MSKIDVYFREREELGLGDGTDGYIFKDDDLVKALESRFSLHDTDMIYNLLSKFLEIDTDCGRITFNDFIKGEVNDRR